MVFRNDIMSAIRIYTWIVATYGLLSIIFQKNPKTILFSKTRDKTYLPILITFIFTLTAIPFESLYFQRPINHWLFWLGVTLCIFALFIRVKGQLDLRYGFSTRIEKQENHKLVTAGLYSIVRHPLYLAMILLLIGANIMLSARYSWIIMLINAYTLKIRIDKEEEFLMKNFTEYADYRKKTKKIIPFIW